MRKTIIVLVCALFMWSCNQSPDTTTESSDEEIENHDDHHFDENEPLELNNGARWIVNDEMKPFVQKGHELVNAFIAERRNDYQDLAEQLTVQNNQLIQSCTMEGKSHDELHKWLHPHLELVQELGSKDNGAEADKIVVEIQQSYLEYQKYFD